jgi:hypothetical protein
MKCNCKSCRSKARIESILERAKLSGKPPTEEDFEEMEKEVRNLHDIVYDGLTELGMFPEVEKQLIPITALGFGKPSLN